MGYLFGHNVQISLDDHIKIMGDEELLDFWEESQLMEEMASDRTSFSSTPHQTYERLILQELQLRLCRPAR